MAVSLGAFAAFAASQIATPGPANMAMLSTGAAYGFRAALPFVAGVVPINTNELKKNQTEIQHKR